MTPFTVLHPAQLKVIGVLNFRKVRFVAALATSVFEGKETLFGCFVTSPTGRTEVRTGQGEARPLVLGDLSLGLPVVLTVTVLTIVAKQAIVNVGMAASTALSRKDLNGPAIVMAAQALGLCVGTLQGVARVLEVVDLKVLDEICPS